MYFTQLDSGAQDGSKKPDTDRQFRPGTVVGQYELVRELGRGGMGAVFLARDTRLGRRVAIKFLHSQKPELTERFIQEARTTAQCEHENIVVIHDVGQYRDTPFMVLEYLRGAPLSEQLGENRRISPARTVELLVPVARALEKAHAYQIVHRDLKPDNIFVTESGTVKVLDFGIAKLVQTEPDQFAQYSAQHRNSQNAPGTATALHTPHPLMSPDGHSVHSDHDTGFTGETGLSSSQTAHGALVGTLPYMSPEQWGVDTIDHRTDIWALGIIMFEMLAGRHPLAPKRGWGLAITGVVEYPMPGIRTVRPDLPDALADIVDSCLRKPKDERMATASDLLQALEPLLPNRQIRHLHAHQSPYTGLNAFQENDSQRFFGRSDEVAEAVTRLRHQPLLAVVGPSGVGKSSFVRAGLIPALKNSGESWAAEVLRPGRSPMDALANLLSSIIGSSSSTDLRSNLSEHQNALYQLRAEPGILGTILRKRARAEQRRFLIFVDQFEELYTLGADELERRAFTTCLASIADDPITPLRVVLSIRSDFLDRVPEDRYFMTELSRGLFFFTTPGREGLRSALIQPAEMAGYRFESSATVDDMLSQLEHMSGALPMLQFAASKLWECRDRKRKLLTDEAYRELGGIAGALASHADAVLGKSSPRDRELIRAIVTRLVTAERTRAIVSTNELSQLSPDPRAVPRLLDHLVEARLLVVHADADGTETGVADGAASVELVHDSLIHSWPQLRRWLDANQEHAAFLQQVRSAATQWRDKGRRAGLLWRGDIVIEARRWRAGYLGGLAVAEEQFLAAVFALDTRTRRRKRIALVSVIGFLSLLVAMAAVALVQISRARQESDRQARAASSATEEAERQLQRAERERDERERAEKAALEAKDNALAERSKAQAYADQVSRQNAELADREDRLTRALRRAQRQRRRLRRQKAELQAQKQSLQEKNTEILVQARKLELRKEELLKIVAACRKGDGPVRAIYIIKNIPTSSQPDEVPDGPDTDSPPAQGTRQGQ